jgi:type IX secretion system PorP/SprF family membrane protein
MPLPLFRLLSNKTRGVLAGGLLMGLAPAAQAQDVYFSQPFATRLHSNPAFAGLLDDYSFTFGYRNQYPSLTGTYKTNYGAADVRLDTPGQHHALGLLLNHDRTGALSYTRFEVGAIYAYHTRLTKQLALSGGLRASYGRQQVPLSNFLFGDQISEDGTVLGPSTELIQLPPGQLPEPGHRRRAVFRAGLAQPGRPAPQPAVTGVSPAKPITHAAGLVRRL